MLGKPGSRGVMTTLSFSATTGKQLFAICCFFAVCWLMAKTLFAISYQKPHGKEQLMPKVLFAISQLFAVCQLTAKSMQADGTPQPLSPP